MSSYEKALKLYNAKLPGASAPKKQKETKKKKLNVSVEELKRQLHADGKMKNSDLDLYFEVQRREHLAAIRIQQTWKKCQRLKPWTLAVKRILAVRKIQKVARGMLARKFVARWYNVRTRIVIELQARIRKYLSNKHLRPKMRHEQTMAVQIQRIVRGRLGRLRYERIKRNFAAIRIQCLWRGVHDRVVTDRKWLNQKVIVIQNCMRKKIAMNKFKFLYSRYNTAATKIQRKFRMFLASQRVARMLYEREMNYRLNTIKMLSNEEEISQERILRLMNRVVKQQVRENTTRALQALQKAESEIYVKENDLVELRRQREILSPRAIERGFFEDLTKNIEQTHEDLAKMKVHHLFVLSRELHHHERIFENQVADLEELAANRNRVSQWRIDEYDEKRHINYQRDINERRRERRLAVADERRRWQVLYYTRDGKPDKKRRPGRPWDKSVFAGAERATYSGAGIDLLAFLRTPPDEKKGKSTKDLIHSVKSTVGQYSLQTYLDQVRVYEQLLNPISAVLQKHMGLLPTAAVAPQDSGWGEIGAELAPALQQIGVEPPPEMNLLKLKRNIVPREVKQRELEKRRRQRGDGPPIALDPGSTFGLDGASTIASPSALSPLASSPASPKSLGSSQASESITGDSLRQTLSRYWKKPYEPALPTEQSFAAADFAKLDYQQIYGPVDEEEAAAKDKKRRKKAGQVGGSKKVAFSQSQSMTRLSTLSEKDERRETQSTSTASPAFSLTGGDSLASPSLLPSAASKKSSRLTTKFSELISAASSIQSDELLSPYQTEERQRAETLRVRREEHEKRRERKKDLQASLAGSSRVSVIPWELLDEVDGAKTKFENEKAYVEFYKKF